MVPLPRSATSAMCSTVTWSMPWRVNSSMAVAMILARTAVFFLSRRILMTLVIYDCSHFIRDKGPAATEGGLSASGNIDLLRGFPPAQVRRASGRLLSGKSAPRAAAAMQAKARAQTRPSTETSRGEDEGEDRTVSTAPPTTEPTAIH